MEPLRVENRNSSLWFFPPVFLLLVIPFTWRSQPGFTGWVLFAINVGLFAWAAGYAFYGAKRGFEFGEEITIHYQFRSRSIPWSDLSFFDVDHIRAKLKTGIPLVSVPTENHQLTLRFRDGHSSTIDIEPALIPRIVEVMASRATLDLDAEQARQQKSADSDASFDQWTWVIVGVVLTSVSTWLMLSGRERMSVSLASAKWPSAPVIFTRIHVKSEKNPKYRGSTIGREKPLHYFPEVNYSYKVNGVEYEGSNFSYVPHKSDDQNEMAKLVQAATSGNNRVVYYNPADHSMSVLIPGGTGNEELVLIALIVVAIAGLILICVYLRRIIKRQSQAPVG